MEGGEALRGGAEPTGVVVTWGQRQAKEKEMESKGYSSP